MNENRLMYNARVLMFTILAVFSITSASWAANYYVALTGNDTNPGTLNSPFRTIQKGLNVLQPGDTCFIRSGTYNEALVLGQSGTSTAPITIQSYSGETVTVSSGTSKSLRIGGRKHYYTIDGLRFISNHATFDQYGEESTLDFQGGAWSTSTDPNGGNNGFIIRNCYIEGAIYIYGHYNTIENCELNGKSLWGNGIWERDALSHDNIYRKNTIHDYTTRGVWSMQLTNGVIIEDNIIYNITNCGIDCDGATHPVYNSIVRRNTIYNVGGRGIECENGFNSLVEKNIIHDSKLYGIHYINYGAGPDFTSDAEYRTTNTNGIIRNNLVYNIANAGIVFTASPGNKVYNNTVYNVQSSLGGIVTMTYGGFSPTNLEIRNNLVSECKPYAVFISSPSSTLLNIQLSNNLYYNSSSSNTHYYQNLGTYNLEGYKSKTGNEQNSIFANPAFLNPANADFSLFSTSQAIGAGITLADVLDDIKGISRPKNDIGAFEFSTGTTPVTTPVPAPSNLIVL